MNKKRGNRRKKFLLLGFLSLLTLLLLLSTGKRGFIRQLRVKQEKKRLERQIEAIQEEKKKLEEEKAKLNDPQYIEKVAREEYGMAKEKEKVYQVVPDEKK